MKSIYQTMYEELGEILNERVKENSNSSYSIESETRWEEDWHIISRMVGLKNKYAYEIYQEDLRNKETEE